MNSIGGNVIVTNGIDYDYCFEQSIRSLLPICDVVNVCDSDSADGTRQILDSLAKEYPKVRVLNYPWPNEEGNRDCVLDKMNWSRTKLGTDYHLHLEADEVLGEESYEYLLEAASEEDSVLGFTRFNFWEDAQHLLASGQVLSPMVIRFAPTKYWMGGDAPHSRSRKIESLVRWESKEACHIYHYGFLRRPECYLRKSNDLVRSIHGSDYVAKSIFYEPLKRCVQSGGNWMKEVGLSKTVFSGTHPNSMADWLSQRGYSA